MTVQSLINKAHNKTGRIYCKMGDTLNVLADHVDVLIVENAKGERFSIQTKDVKYDSKIKEGAKQALPPTQNTQGQIDF